jgi:hypothetical protein
MNNNLTRVPGFSSPSSNSRNFTWSRLSTNYMEVLVRDEVERQVDQLPPDVKAMANYADIAAYALNRLPSLYATTKRGRMIQQWKAEASLRLAVKQAVQQGVAVFQKDPRRIVGEPWEDPGIKSADAALNELKALLQYQDLTWDNVASVVKSRMLQVGRGEIKLASQ